MFIGDGIGHVTSVCHPVPGTPDLHEEGGRSSRQNCLFYLFPNGSLRERDPTIVVNVGTGRISV